MEDIKTSLEVMKLFKEVMMLFKNSIVKEFDHMNLTAPQGMLMGLLGKYGKMKISELSDKLSLSNSTVSGIVDRLEKQGMVERVRSEEDKRVVYVCISPKCECTHREFHNKGKEKIKSIMSKAAPEDIKKITDGLNTLKKLLKEN